MTSHAPAFNVAAALEQLHQDKSLHRHLPHGGLIHIERHLPYLVVYRRSEQAEDAFSGRLDRTEASYLVADTRDDELLQELLLAWSTLTNERYGGSLVIELWTRAADADPTPMFRLLGPDDKFPAVIHRFKEVLEEVEVPQYQAAVVVDHIAPRCPDLLQPLLSKYQLKESGALLLGLEISQFYLNPDDGQPYPILLRQLRTGLSRALKRGFFEFVRLQTDYNATHFHMLGTTVLGEVARKVDRALLGIADRFSFLLQVSPINTGQAWEAFEASDYREVPNFVYRMLPIDPELVKRELYNIPIEQVEDPTIAYLFRDKRSELDRMLTMLSDRGTHRFVSSSVQLFGGVDTELKEVAQALLTAIPRHDDQQDDVTIGAAAFAEQARAELSYLKQQYSEVDDVVDLREDVASLIVSSGKLCVNSHYKVKQDRVEALIQHEIGTHVLTYYNGKAQPIQQLYSGVPGYEELQEGLAVLAEYIVGGLTNNRLRLLAGRVAAVDMLIQGATFLETFERLHEHYNFTAKGAFHITTRVYRGGGLTKDAVYLKGLINLLRYLEEGGELAPLLIGKIRQDYLHIVEELIHRKVLVPPPLRPRYLSDPQYADVLTRLREGMTVFNMIQY